MATIFTNPNDRVFYACMGVFYIERQTTYSMDSKDEPTDGKFLNGVQSVGVDRSQTRTSMLDVGRWQRKYGTYGKQEFSITIERLVNTASVDGSSDNQGITSFFYNVDGKTTYSATHILNSSNLGASGFKNELRNYDIILVYAPDSFKRLGAGTGTDADKFMATQYRCCLLTEISYSIPVNGPVIETLTFTSHIANQIDVSSKDWDDMKEPEADQTGETIRRQDIDTTNSVFPLEVQRMFELGTSEAGIPILGLQSIDISATIEYSDIMDVGQWRGSNLTGDAVTATLPDPPHPFAGRSEPAGSTNLRAEQNLYRQVILPIDIGCSFTGIGRSQYRAQPNYQAFENTDTTFSATDGDDDHTLKNNYNGSRYEANRSILVAAQKESNYFQWNLGKRNYLENISYTGGDTGGSNVEVTMSYKNETSDFVLMKAASIVDIDPPTRKRGLQIYY